MRAALALALVAAALPAAAEPARLHTSTGIASWYGPFHHGRTMANGRRFDRWARTAAHRTLPLGTVLRVTDAVTGRSARVTITDRGPYIQGREIDLSQGAARAIGLERRGVGPVILEERRR